jgi:translation elongation factor EF-1beta
MGAIKNFIQKIKDRREVNKEEFREAERQRKIERLLNEREKSANERELEGYIKENREQEIKKALEIARKKRQEDISFGHNSLNTKNIMADTKWHIMKEKNMFKDNKNMFVGNKFVHKGNPKLLNNSNMFKL